MTALGCIALVPGYACAFQPLITDDTGTQGTGGNQIEVGYNRTMETVAGTKTVTGEVPLVYTRGITDVLDVYVGAPYQKIDVPAPSPSARGWGNTALGVKWRFYENEASKLSFALKPELRLPVSEARETRGLGTARATYSAGLLATQETTFGALHANLAVERVTHADSALDAAERRTLYRASLAPVWDVTAHWKLALDAGWVTNPDPSAHRYLGYIEIGTIYAPAKDVEIALGIVRNFHDGSVSATQATLGLTWRFR